MLEETNLFSIESEVIPLKDNIYKVILGAMKNDKGSVSGEVELDFKIISQFESTMFSLIDKGITNIVFDMTYVETICSSGIWSLSQVYKKANDQNGTIVLFNIRQYIKRLLESIAMNKKIKCVDSEKEAIELIQNIISK